MKKKGIYGNKIDHINLSINAEFGTMNLIGSTLETNNNLNIGNFAIAQNLDGSFITNDDGTFETTSGASVNGVNIAAAQLRSEHFETHQRSNLSLGNTLRTVLSPIAAARQALDIYLFAATPSLKKDTLKIDDTIRFERSRQTTSAQATTLTSSNLIVGGDFMINSNDDVNVEASNLDIAGNALLNVEGNLNIIAQDETFKSTTKEEQITIGTINITRDISHASGSAGIEGVGFRSEEEVATSTQKSSNINISGSLLANVSNELSTPLSGNLTMQASNLTVEGDSIIRTAGDFNLVDAKDTSSYSSKESALTVEAGARIGNAYVDAAYAWKAVAEAQKKAIEAAEKLKRMEKLQDEGRASARAVELATAQLILAQSAVASATIAASAASAGSASAAATSFGTGFYGAGYLNTTASGIKTTTNTSLAKSSNFIANGDININSNNNINATGSTLTSLNGDITLSANNNININETIQTKALYRT